MSLVSVVLPTYNERQGITSVVTDLLAVASKACLDVELLVVDDNSPDRTATEVAARFAHDPRVRVHVRTERGLAGAVGTGVKLARGDVVVVMDTDGNHDPALVSELVQTLHGADIVVGSRYMPTGGMPTSRFRYVSSLMFNRWACSLLRLPVSDCLSGFLCFRRTLFDQMDRNAIFVGYGDYAIRLLHWATSRRLKLVEIPTVYGHRRGGVSKTSFISVWCRYSWTVIRLRYIR